jgi:hypothetical protein
LKSIRIIKARAMIRLRNEELDEDTRSANVYNEKSKTDVDGIILELMLEKYGRQVRN